MESKINPQSGGSLELCSVSELVKRNEACLNVAFYQRGYRWKSQQVQQLLNDIGSFSSTHKATFYFLQALVVSEKDGIWNVVDGQQRLTTIALIQKVLNTPKSISLKYERNSANGEVGAIDKHYRGEAEATINKWFIGKTEADKIDFATKLNEAKFLLYRIPYENELAVFGRLNSGKIDAKDSELVKCVMLTPQIDEPLTVTQARAREWDEIDRALTDNQFFAFFVPRNTWREEDRMAMLFCSAKLCVHLDIARENNEVFPFLTCVQQEIKESSRGEVWKKIYSAYYTLAAWHKDPLMYHAAGWFMHHCGSFNICKSPLEDIRAKLYKALVKIENYVIPSPKEDSNNKTDYFNVPHLKEQAREYLLLHNIAFCWQHYPMRYNFYKHKQVESWSLEHIVARNERDLTKDSFIRFSPQFLTETNWPAYEEACLNNQGDNWLASILPAETYPLEDDHNIQNLALLGTNANSSLSDNLFEGKRQLIVEWSMNQTYWVPPATQAVFFKTIADVDLKTPYWSQVDKQTYVKSMKKDVHAFVKAVEGAF